MEVLILIEKKRVKFTWDEFNQKISELPNVIVYPIGMDVMEVLRKHGRNLELHDRVLVATAIIHKAMIISKDREIAAIKEIKTIW